MDANNLNRIATGSALVGLLTSLGSLILPLGTTATSLLAVVGFGALVVAMRVAQPPEIGEREPIAEFTADKVLGIALATMATIVSLLLAAASAARFGDVRYLGESAFFLAENFTVVTGPFVALLSVATLMASQGRLEVRARAAPGRHAATAIVLGLTAVTSLLFALGTVGEPWQAPYLLAVGAVIAWLDAIQTVGLPSPAQVGSWLERGETEQSRFVVRALARYGNGTVLVLAVAGLALFAAGRSTPAAVIEAVAVVLLTFSTHAAASLTKALPAEIGDELEATQGKESRLQLLSLGPLAVAILAAAFSGLAFVGLIAGGSILDLLAVARPAIGAALAVLAGVNLARSGLPRFQEHGPVRRAVSTTTASILAASLFFALLVELGIMTGPITDAGLELMFSYAALFGASVFVLARGLYPIPGVEAGEKPGEDEEPRVDEDAKLERSLMTVYVASSLFVLGAIALIALAMFGKLDAALPQAGQGRDAAYLATVGVGVVLIIGLAVVFFRSRQLETPHAEEEVDFERSYTPQEVMRLTVLGVSGTIAFVLGLLGVLVLVGQLKTLGGLTLETRHSTDFFVFAILVGIGPAGYLHNRERKRIKAIDQRLPEFLRDLAESQRTGMTLTQAVITSSKGNYGALTPEIKKMAAQIEWGVSFDRALRSFAERVDTPLVQRTVSLVIEASNSGGDVMEVLEAAADDAREIQMIKQERKSGMQIYVMIIYIAFFVFLGVIGILNVKFMPEVAKAVAGAEGVSVGSITFKEFDVQTFQTLFFHASVIQGLGGGFVAGSMEEGKPVAGLKHAFAMTIIAYIAFRFFLGG